MVGRASYLASVFPSVKYFNKFQLFEAVTKGSEYQQSVADCCDEIYFKNVYWSKTLKQSTTHKNFVNKVYLDFQPTARGTQQAF